MNYLQSSQQHWFSTTEERWFNADLCNNDSQKLPQSHMMRKTGGTSISIFKSTNQSTRLTLLVLVIDLTPLCKVASLLLNHMLFSRLIHHHKLSQGFPQTASQAPVCLILCWFIYHSGGKCQSIWFKCNYGKSVWMTLQCWQMEATPAK